MPGKRLARFTAEVTLAGSAVYLCYANGRPLARKDWQQVYESPDAAGAEAVCAALNSGLVTEVTAALIVAAGAAGKEP
jgi:hypothetical protein